MTIFQPQLIQNIAYNTGSSPLKVAKRENHVTIVKLLEADLATTAGEFRLAEKNLA